MKQASELDSAAGNFVDIQMKDNQFIRVKVPVDIDPQVFANEYINANFCELPMIIVYTWKNDYKDCEFQNHRSRTKKRHMMPAAKKSAKDASLCV